MERQPPQVGAPDLPAVGKHLAHIEAAIGHLRDHIAGDGAANFRQLLAG
jgi:hypothetical protein